MLKELNWKRARLSRDTRCTRCSRVLLAGQTAIYAEGAKVCDPCWDEVRRQPNRPVSELLRDLGAGRSAPRSGGGSSGARRAASKPVVETWLDGFKLVGETLDRAAQDTKTTILHDRARPGTDGERFEHLAVGPAGVSVVVSEHYNFAVEIEPLVGWASDTNPPNLLINKRPRRDIVDQAVAQRDAMGAWIESARLGFEVPVNAAIAFREVTGVDRSPVRDVIRVRIDTADKVAEWAIRRGPLIGSEIRALTELFAE